MIGLLLRVLLASAAAVVTAVMAGSMALGVMWLYIFGDDPWPAWSETAITGIALLAGIATFAGVLYGSLRRPARPPGP